MTEKDSILVFLNKVTPKLGPVNALNLAKDAHIRAFRELFKELGLPESKIDSTIDIHLQKMAQEVLNKPAPSPYFNKKK